MPVSYAEEAEECYADRPCDFKHSEDQTKKEFATRLCEYAGHVASPGLVKAIMALIDEHEGE